MILYATDYDSSKAGQNQNLSENCKIKSCSDILKASDLSRAQRLHFDHCVLFHRIICR